MKFYVYVHKRATNGKVFYVGKGTGKRCRDRVKRSQHWKNVAAKHGYTIEIVKNNLAESEAFDLEIELIAKYKSEGLCNKTSGGEGPSGFVMTPKQRIRKKAAMNRPEVKEKLRLRAIEQFSNPKAIEKARENSIRQFSNPENIEKIRKKTIERFNTPEKRSKHAQAKPVRCVQNGMIFGATTLAAEWVSSLINRKADNSNIAAVCRGRHKSAYGFSWEYLNFTKVTAKLQA